MHVECPYCGRDAVLMDSRQVYSRSYGNIWCCMPCEAWVGVHKNSKSPPNKPLGRLANKELRGWKVRAHAVFNPLFERIVARTGCSKSYGRGRAYKWLASQLDIEMSECHIGMFDVDLCKRVVDICMREMADDTIDWHDIKPKNE